MSTIRVFTSNVRGVVKNWDAIKKINLKDYDIILLNEIWQIRDYENINIAEFKIANVSQRASHRGGGSMIYIRDTITYDKVESPNIENIIESTAILVNNNVIACIYRPPSGNKNQFKDALTTWITNRPNRNVYVAGDFNLNMLNQDKLIFDSIEALTGLAPKIRDVTRVHSNSCIDNILTNLEGTNKVSNIFIADHQGLISEIKMSVKKIVQKQFKYREMKEENWRQFSIEVENLKIKGSSINDKWTNICHDIRRAVEKSFPEKQSRIKYSFVMSQGLLKSKNKKNKLLRQYKNGAIAKEVYIRYNRIYRKLITKEQEKTFSSRILESGQDSKKKMEGIKRGTQNPPEP